MLRNHGTNRPRTQREMRPPRAHEATFILYGMEIAMLLSERTFENLDLSRDIEPGAMFPGPVAEPEQPTQPSAIATLGPQIEAEIPFLQRVVRRWYREAADADDLVQDTLLRALASAHLWQPGSNLRAWLVTIMRNQFLE